MSRLNVIASTLTLVNIKKILLNPGDGEQLLPNPCSLPKLLKAIKRVWYRRVSSPIVVLRVCARMSVYYFTTGEVFGIRSIFDRTFYALPGRHGAVAYGTCV